MSLLLALIAIVPALAAGISAVLGKMTQFWAFLLVGNVLLLTGNALDSSWSWAAFWAVIAAWSALALLIRIRAPKDTP